MIDYEFGPPYEHSELDLCGIWDSLDSITIGFMVARDDSGPPRSANYLHRSRKLSERIGKLFFKVSAEMHTVHPTAQEGDNLLILPSELYLEEPTEGIILIEASRLQTGAEDPMEQCLAITAEIYGDLMYERAAQSQ